MLRLLSAITFAGVLTLMSLAVPAGAAQEHAVSGTVTDTTGGVLVGATVTLSGGPDGTRAVLTTGRGEFSFQQLPAGRYQLHVQSPGFAEFTRTIDVPGIRTPINVTLQVEITDRVDVSVVTANVGSAGVMSTATISGAALAALPDDPYAMLRRLQELAGATGDPSKVVVSVDGFRQTVRLPPKAAIQLIRIGSNPFAPEYPELARARIDVVTKPGSTAVNAELRATFNDAVMNAPNALAPGKTDEQMRHASGYLSGPIVPNHWSFVAYGGSWSTDLSHVINATGVDPASGAVVPLSGSVLTPNRLTNVWLGNDLRLSAAHTLNVSGGFTEDSVRNGGLESGLDLPQRAFNSTGDLREVRLSLQSMLGGRMLNELRGMVSRRRATVRAVDITPAVLVLDAFYGGGNQTYLFNDAGTTALQLIQRLTTSVGRHTLKLGADLDGAEFSRTDMANFGGTFLFGADFERSPSGEPMLNEAGDRIAISPLENYRRTVLGVPGYAPSQFFVTRGNPDLFLRQWWGGWFAQDDWTLHPRLTVSYGIRQEFQSDVDGVAFAPRAGVAWAVDEARRNLVRAGAGVFYTRVEPDLTFDVQRSDQLQQLLIVRPGFFPDVPATPSGQNVLPTAFVRAPELVMPQTLRVALAYERQLPRGGLLTLGYDRQEGRNLLRTRNINAPDSNGVRPDPTRGPVLQYESTARRERHEVSVGFRLQPNPRLSGFVNYSYVDGRSDTDGRSTVPADSHHLESEYGYIAADRPHQVSAGGWMTFPGGLTVAPFVTFASGRAFNITTGFDNNLDGLFTDRPGVGTAGSSTAIDTPYGLFDLAPHAPDQIILRNAGREPRQIRVDVNVTQQFESVGIYFGVDVENVFNRANFTGINGVLTSPSFGQPALALNPRRASVFFGFNY